MSYVQCKDLKEAEEVCETRTHAFMSEDFRIYDKITLSDESSFHFLDSKTMVELMHFKNTIECLDEHTFEITFTNLVENAKMAQEAYEKVREILKLKAKP